MTANRRWWRPRFSIKAVLIAMTAIAVGTVWLIQKPLRQREAVAELTKEGVDVVYERRTSFHPLNWSPDWLRQRLGTDFFNEVKTVSISGRFVYSQPIRKGQTLVQSERTAMLRKLRQNPLVFESFVSRPIVVSVKTMNRLSQLPFLESVSIRAIPSWHPDADNLVKYSVDPVVIDEEALKSLSHLTALKELDLVNLAADDRVLTSLTGCRSLQKLSLGSAEFTARGAAALGDLTNLEELAFEPPSAPLSLFSRSGARQESTPFPEAFPVLPKLRVLDISGYTITTRSAQQLQHCGELKELRCDTIKVDDEGIGYLSRLSHLQTLNLLDSTITDRGAPHLAQMRELRTLVLTNSQLTDDGFRHLSPLTKLETLYVPHMRITDAALQHLGQATNLHTLSLEGSEITGKGLEHLAGLTELTRLNLSFTQLTDEAVESLLKLPKLNLLQLAGTRISQQGAERLRAGLPKTQIRFPDHIQEK